MGIALMKFLIIKGSMFSGSAREMVDYWEWNFDQRCGFPNQAGISTYSDGGITHPNDPEGIYKVAVQILPWAENFLTEEEKQSLLTYENLINEGWFNITSSNLVE